MNRWKERAKLPVFLALVLILTLAVLPIARVLADNVVNDVTAGGNDTFTAPGSTVIGYRINTAAAQDPQAGCNVSDGTPATITLSVPNGVTASTTSLTFTDCKNTQYVTFSSSVGGDYPIPVVEISDAGGGGYKNLADFTLHVAAPANTPPMVVVTGVAEGQVYGKGSVPAAICAVTDAEDGNSTFAAAISGTLDADGLGSQTAECAYTDAGELTATASATYTIADLTPPTISYVLNPAAPDGANGWYRSDVSLIWLVSESESPTSQVKDGCVDVVITADQAETLYSCSASSAGGSAGPVTVAIKRDATAPVVTLTAERGPDSNGWYNHPVTFTVSSQDAGAVCDGPVTYAGPDGGAVTVSGSCSDPAGNVGLASVSLQYDATAPSISPAVTPERPAAGWWNLSTGAPAVTYICSDAVSGVASCSLPFAFGEGENLAHSGTAVDNAGNSASASVEDIDVDLQAPAISAALAPERPASGWWNLSSGAPTVTFTCSDSGPSGLAGCPEAYTFGEGADQSRAETVYDRAGNSASAGVNDVDVDLSVPLITFTGRTAANEYGWNNTDVTATWSCADSLSGAASPATSTTVSSEGLDQTATGVCADLAGNTAENAVGGINIDKTAPTLLAALDRQPAVTGWFNIATGAPSVAFSCDDTGSAPSGLASACPAISTFGEGANQSRSETIYDRAGNSSTAGVAGISVDLTAPVITDLGPTTLPDGANGWYIHFVINEFAASDTLSGLTGPSTILVSTAAQEGSAVKVSSGTAADAAGNVAPAIESAAFMIDLSNPTNIAFVGGPDAGGAYYFGFVPPAPTCTADDAVSGLASCMVSGYSSAVGAHTLTATAIDNAGRTAAITRNYTVLAWTLKGFYQPVDMNGVFNSVKNGSTVPLKFEIFAGPTELTDTAYIKSLMYGLTTCGVNTPSDEIETLATGGTVLRYDTTGGQFIFNWKTPSTSGKCYRVTMTTLDGSSLVAYFKLK